MLPAQVLQPPPPLAGAVGAADWGGGGMVAKTSIPCHAASASPTQSSTP